MERLCAFIAALIVASLMFLTAADVLGRYVFNYPIPGAYELSEFMLIGIVFLSVAYVQLLKQHARVEMLVDRLSKKARLGLRLLGDVIGLSVLSVMTWQGGLLAWRAWQTKEYAGAAMFYLPYWPAKAVFTLGVGLLFLRLVLDTVNDAAQIKEVGVG